MTSLNFLFLFSNLHLYLSSPRRRTLHDDCSLLHGDSRSVGLHTELHVASESSLNKRQFVWQFLDGLVHCSGMWKYGRKGTLPSHRGGSCCSSPILSLSVIAGTTSGWRELPDRDGASWGKGGGERGRKVLREITIREAKAKVDPCAAARHRATTRTVGRTFIRSRGSASVTNGVVSLLRARISGSARQPGGPLARRRKSDRRWRTEIRTDDRARELHGWSERKKQLATGVGSL